MQLIKLQQHFFNNNISHYMRLSDWSHDVYLNPSNNNKFTIPIDEDEIPDDYCQLGCMWLGIQGIHGEPHEQLMSKVEAMYKGSKPEDIN